MSVRGGRTSRYHTSETNTAIGREREKGREKERGEGESVCVREGGGSMRGRLDHEKERERESVRPRERERTRVQYWKPLSLSSLSLSLSLSLSFSHAHHSLASPRSFPARLGDRPRQRGVPASLSPLHVIAAPASTCTSGESTQPTSRRPRCPASPHRGPRTDAQSRTDLLQTRPQRTPPLLQPFSCFIKQSRRTKESQRAIQSSFNDITLNI